MLHVLREIMLHQSILPSARPIRDADLVVARHALQRYRLIGWIAVIPRRPLLQPFRDRLRGKPWPILIRPTLVHDPRIITTMHFQDRHIRPTRIARAGSTVIIPCQRRCSERRDLR